MLALKVDFDDRQLRSFASALSETRLLQAARRASKKAAQWMHLQVSRQVADEARFPRRLVKMTRGRVYDKGWRRKSTDSGYAYKVWVGLDPLPADWLGKPRALRKGYAVRGRQFPDAFMPSSGRYADRMYRRTTRHRMPIQRVRVEWDQIGRRVFEQQIPRLHVRYRELMLQELRFEVLRASGVARAGGAKR